MVSKTSRLSFGFGLRVGPLVLGIAALGLGLTGCGKKGKVYFGNLQDGAQVESPFTVEMKAENLVVEAASNGVIDGHGHFHILVDVPVPMSLDPVPKDAQHIHYGDGQTEAVLDLPPGDHTLTLQFAHGDHRPYDPQISQEIKIHVTRQAAPQGAAGSADTKYNDQSGHRADSRTDDMGRDTVNKTPTPNIQSAPGGGGMGSGH